MSTLLATCQQIHGSIAGRPTVNLARPPKIHKITEKIENLLHKWTVGPICPDRYGRYLSFSSGTSQEMSLSKPLESTQRWRGEAAPTLG